jgi:hypothetical protein
VSIPLDGLAPGRVPESQGGEKTVRQNLRAQLNVTPLAQCWLCEKRAQGPPLSGLLFMWLHIAIM